MIDGFGWLFMFVVLVSFLVLGFCCYYTVLVGGLGVVCGCGLGFGFYWLF